jgi:O-acetyl-ADP-ribose deacetylase
MPPMELQRCHHCRRRRFGARGAEFAARIFRAKVAMSGQLRAYRGDITTLRVDAIVNAANSTLARGGGVCGAIFAAAGPELDDACAALGGCPTGDARITPGFRLAARFVVHAVGPVWGGGGQGEAELLASAYRRAAEVAREAGATSIAFPAISTGIYGYPAADAAEIAVGTLRESAGDLDVTLVAFDAATYERYEALLA